MSAVPMPTEIIYSYELKVLQTEAMIDALLKRDRDFHILLLDIDGSRIIRQKGIVLRLEVIKELNHLIQKSLSDRDRAYWYGNDEFIVVIQGRDHAGAQAEAERIRELISSYQMSIEEPLEGVDFHGNVTVTGGLVYASEADDVIDLVNLAKKRIAEGKKVSRNRIYTQGHFVFVNVEYSISENESKRLNELSQLRGRGIEHLIREAVDTILSHYPQFHGHRKDREMKLPSDAFAYACSSTGLYIDPAIEKLDNGA